MAAVEDTDQGLIHRADAVAGKQGTLTATKPPASSHAGISSAEPDIP